MRLIGIKSEAGKSPEDHLKERSYKSNDNLPWVESGHRDKSGIGSLSP
jgi:hypothetical protein